MANRIPLLHTLDENGRPISKLMDQYEFVIRNVVDVTTATEYILSAQPSGAFVIQKHWVADDKEYMRYYKESAGRDPLTVWAAELVEETLTYGEVWEVFGNVSFV